MRCKCSRDIFSFCGRGLSRPQPLNRRQVTFRRGRLRNVANIYPRRNGILGFVGEISSRGWCVALQASCASSALTRKSLKLFHEIWTVLSLFISQQWFKKSFWLKFVCFPEKTFSSRNLILSHLTKANSRWATAAPTKAEHRARTHRAITMAMACL